MNVNTSRKEPLQSVRREPSGDPQRSSGQRFRETARRIVTQIDHAEVAADIEEQMWRILAGESEQ